MVFTPRHEQKSTNYSKRRLISFFTLAALVTGVTAYVYLINDLATRGYEIKALQKTLAEEKISSQQLEAEVSARRFNRKVEEGFVPVGFVAVERVEYLSSLPQVGVVVK